MLNIIDTINIINNMQQIKVYVLSYSHSTPTISMSPPLLQLEITPKFLAFLFGVIFGVYFGVFFRIPKLRRIFSVLISDFFWCFLECFFDEGARPYYLHEFYRRIFNLLKTKKIY